MPRSRGSSGRAAARARAAEWEEEEPVDDRPKKDLYGILGEPQYFELSASLPVSTHFVF